MKKIFCFLFFVFLIVSVNAGFFNYSIELMEENAVFTVTMQLESITPTNSFKLNGFSLPENSELVSLEDSIGKIENYSVKNNSLSFTTNTGELREKETVKIEYLVKNIREEQFSPLYFAEISLPGSENSDLTVEVKGQRILSFETSTGFNGEIKGEKLKIVGRGPIGFWIYYSSKGIDFNHFVLFNKSNYSNQELTERGIREADKLFDVIPIIVGLSLPFEKLPLLVLNQEQYTEHINSYSDGVYRTGGLLAINEKSFEDNGTAVVLHEATHAFNAQAMKWNESGAAWFDEGMAKFVEGIIREHRGEKKPNLFRGKISWIEGSYRYTINPKGDYRDFVHYLDQKKEFMKEWDTGNESTRDFWYAFSELYVREFVKEKGFKELQDAYRKMLKVKETITNRTEASNKLVSLLGKPLYPCNNKNENETLECVVGLNEFTPRIPEKTSVLQLGLSESEKEFESIRKQHEMEKKILKEKIKGFREKLLELVHSLFSEIKSKKNQFLPGVKG